MLQKHYKGLLAAGQDNGEAADESVPSLADSEEKIEKINRQPPLDQQDSVEHDEF